MSTTFLSLLTLLSLAVKGDGVETIGEAHHRMPGAFREQTSFEKLKGSQKICVILGILIITAIVCAIIVGIVKKDSNTLYFIIPAGILLLVGSFCASHYLGPTEVGFTKEEKILGAIGLLVLFSICGLTIFDHTESILLFVKAICGVTITAAPKFFQLFAAFLAFVHIVAGNDVEGEKVDVEESQPAQDVLVFNERASDRVKQLIAMLPSHVSKHFDPDAKSMLPARLAEELAALEDNKITREQAESVARYLLKEYTRIIINDPARMPNTRELRQYLVDGTAPLPEDLERSVSLHLNRKLFSEIPRKISEAFCLPPQNSKLPLEHLDHILEHLAKSYEKKNVDGRIRKLFNDTVSRYAQGMIGPVDWEDAKRRLRERTGRPSILSTIMNLFTNTAMDDDDESTIAGEYEIDDDGISEDQEPCAADDEGASSGEEVEEALEAALKVAKEEVYEEEQSDDDEAEELEETIEDALKAAKEIAEKVEADLEETLEDHQLRADGDGEDTSESRNIKITIGSPSRKQTVADRCLRLVHEGASEEVGKNRFQQILDHICQNNPMEARLQEYIPVLQTLGTRKEIELPVNLAKRLGASSPGKISRLLAPDIAVYLAKLLTDESLSHLPNNCGGREKWATHQGKLTFHILQALSKPSWVVLS
ncbi:uncharacterized protein BXIN_1483 [Babesia sp. Xinjiang]|uniref:uncharacterized protein n=1 Tax=Babesia sp. Xinjiang TaxID=462227 RepID=UPI000A25BFA2|nr:uncharacterized protein BXIN_1483 [Babesia sp. Xinjiang]ORM40179.1 hypothetical protein BXIN_1483 [Babesia sp. Xinjiang]